MKELNSILLVWCLTGIVLCSGAALYFWRFEKKHPEVKLADGNPDIKRKYHSAVMLVFGFIFALILGLICVLAYLTEMCIRDSYNTFSAYNTEERKSCRNLERLRKILFNYSR